MGDDQPPNANASAKKPAPNMVDRSRTLNNAASRPSLSGLGGAAGGGNEIVMSEISRMDNRLEMIENKGALMQEAIVKEVTDKLLGKNSDLNKRLHKMQLELDAAPTQIETAILDRVGELLTDNIYDVIPGYQELEEAVARLGEDFSDQKDEVA